MIQGILQTEHGWKACSIYTKRELRTRGTLDLSQGKAPHNFGGTELRDLQQAEDLNTSFGSAHMKYTWHD